VVAPTRMPSLRNSPWIRTQPQPGFSRPRRSTSSRSPRSIGGRPGEQRRNVHFLATSSRCQRSSVCGETGNTGHRSRGNSALAAASNRRLRRDSGGRFSVRATRPAHDVTPRSPPPARPPMSPRRTLEGVSGQPHTSGRRAPADRTDRSAWTRISISAPYRLPGACGAASRVALAPNQGKHPKVSRALLPCLQTIASLKRPKIKAFQSEVGANFGANFDLERQERKRKAPLCGAFP
jgi:hypothetical protein